ncbi:MAG: adenylate kinase [Anaerolineales bacterium]|jgi:adenylate kinase
MAALNIVMLGPPGAGKGTQAKRITKVLCVPHVSTGDLFREHLKNKTELGQLANQYMAKGELVPDDVTIEMVRDRLSRADCGDGVVLDGFPRTCPQAEALDELLRGMNRELSAVFYIRLDDDSVIRRLSGRRVCPNGHLFHVDYSPPETPGVCDHDGLELYQRDDDKEETVKDRLRVYLKDTAPLIDYYRDRGLLNEFDGDQPVEAVTVNLLESIQRGAFE